MGGCVLEILGGWVSNPPPPLQWGWDVSGILGGFPFYPLSAAVSISRHNMNNFCEGGLYVADLEKAGQIGEEKNFRGIMAVSMSCKFRKIEEAMNLTEEKKAGHGFLNQGRVADSFEHRLFICNKIPKSLKTGPMLVPCVLLWWLAGWLAGCVVGCPTPPPPVGVGQRLVPGVSNSGWEGLVIPPPPPRPAPC